MSERALLTNHAHVLLCVAERPDVRLREIADCVGVTERAVHRMVCELEHDGYIHRRRVGRRNVYELHPKAPLRHELESPATVGDLVAVLRDRSGAAAAGNAA